MTKFQTPKPQGRRFLSLGWRRWAQASGSTFHSLFIKKTDSILLLPLLTRSHPQAHPG